MTWVNLCVAMLLTGQIEAGGTVPTPAVRDNPPATAADAAPDRTSAGRDANPPPAESEGRQQRDPLEPREAPRNVAPPDAWASPKNAPPPATQAQVPPPAEPVARPDSAAPPDNPPARANPPSSSENPPARAKNQAKEIIAEALEIPVGGGIAGQSWPLAQALAASPDQKQQLAIIHGYWHLTEAVAKCHFAFEQTKQFERLPERPGDAAGLRAARSAAAAALLEAEVAVVAAQNDLAALLQLPADSPVPLPGDKPHTGGYRTNYQGLFATRSPPPIARVIDRTLPIRLSAIEERAAAVLASGDAFQAAAESYQSAQADLNAVTAAAAQLIHQQRALVETVCRYNHDIAEYATAVLGPNVTAQQLVGVLIEPGRGARESRGPNNPGDIQPAEYLQPMTPPGRLVPLQPGQSRPMPGQPTPAVRPPKNQPTPAAPETRPKPAKDEPALVPLEENAADHPPALGAAGDEDLPAGHPPRFRTANKNVEEPSNSTASAASPALYPALRDAAPAVRAKQLTLALHWDRSLPENGAKPMRLPECLAREAGGNRRETLAVYWQARQRAAEHQCLAQEAEFLDNLAADALDRRNEPAGAVEMLYLHSARLSAKAALRDAQAALVEAQFELALRTQATAETLWPLPSTPPHSGSYDLNLAALPRQAAQTRPLLRLTAALPAMGGSVQQRAAAVVDADAARAAAVEAYLAGAKPLGTVLQAIGGQTEQTFAYLHILTDYNVAIADYALAVLPADVPAEKLAAALVVQP